jgi:hypothetical protein
MKHITTQHNTTRHNTTYTHRIHHFVSTCDLEHCLKKRLVLREVAFVEHVSAHRVVTRNDQSYTRENHDNKAV